MENGVADGRRRGRHRARAAGHVPGGGRIRPRAVRRGLPPAGDSVRRKGNRGVSMGRVLLAIVWKELRVEWRTGELLLTPVLLALLLMLVFVFALPPAAMRVEGVFTASLWVTLFFAGTVGLSRGFGRERGDGRLAGLLMAPVDRSAVFLAKALSALLFMALITVVMMPVFFGVFGQTMTGPLWQWTAMTALVITAYSGVGTLLAAVAAQ